MQIKSKAEEVADITVISFPSSFLTGLFSCFTSCVLWCFLSLVRIQYNMPRKRAEPVEVPPTSEVPEKKKRNVKKQEDKVEAPTRQLKAKKPVENNDVEAVVPKKTVVAKKTAKAKKESENNVVENGSAKAPKRKGKEPMEEHENNEEDEEEAAPPVSKKPVKPKATKGATRGRKAAKKVVEDEEDEEANSEQEEAVVPEKTTKAKKDTKSSKAPKQKEKEPEKEDQETDEQIKKPKATKATGKGRKATKKVVEDEEEANSEQEEAVVPKKARATKRKVKEPEIDEDEESAAPAAKKLSKPKATRGRKPTKKVDPDEEDEESKSEQEEDEPVKKSVKERKPPVNKTETPWEQINFECKTQNKEDQEANLKITSWNIAGLRGWLKKDGLSILDHEKPDILCLQEIKCSNDKLPPEVGQDIREIYKKYWCPSDKDGYAGVALFTKIMPMNVEYGIGDEVQDAEGRCITAEFEKFYLVCVYVPNSGRKLVTLPKRLEWNKSFKNYIKKLDENKPVIICGDLNVAHQEIDLANPKTNTKNAGFTIEEREGMSDFLEAGFVDTYRKLYPDKVGYTFWTYMGTARSRNVGWRLDYFLVSKRIQDKVCDNVMRTEVMGSDHCPLTLFLNI